MHMHLACPEREHFRHLNGGTSAGEMVLPFTWNGGLVERHIVYLVVDGIHPFVEFDRVLYPPGVHLPRACSREGNQ
jgi:hypothetical protein